MSSDQNEQRHSIPAEQDSNQIRQLVLDFIARRDAGEEVSSATLIAEHPELQLELAEYLAALRNVDSAIGIADKWSDSRTSDLAVRCPTCHQFVQVTKRSHVSNLTCAKCGNVFRIVDERSSITAGTRVDHFEILEKVGAGAFSTVWRARDIRLHRDVALKLPRNGFSDAKEIERVDREARAAARLSHPHIVQVHEVGHHEDLVYLVTDFVEGQTLSDRLGEGTLTSYQAAALCAKLADALEHAHQRGVVHRDLKPSNIMLDVNDQPRIVDFGLAKLAAFEPMVTLDGKLLGTPAYMSPEQARGAAHQASHRSDIYSLGVILFELLTGELPFRGTTQMLVQQVLLEDAPSPRKLNNAVPKDLETICLKCLEKDASSRYATAGDLADDLHRFLRGQPVDARPIKRSARVWRWCRRNPVVTGFAAAFLVAVAVGFGGVTWQWNQAVHARDARQRMAFDLAYDRGLSLCEQGAVDHGMLWLARSLELTPNESTELGRVVRVNLNLWKKHLPQLEQYLSHQGEVWCAAFSPDGKFVLTGSSKRTAQLWNANSGEPVGAPLLHGGRVLAVALSPDGKLILTGSGDGAAQLWDVKTGERVGDRMRHEAAVRSVAFDPDSARILTGSDDKTARLWDVKTSKRISKPMQHGGGVLSVAFSPDGRILTGSYDGMARFWDAQGKTIDNTVAFRGAVWAVTFSSDGSYFAIGGSSDVVEVRNTFTLDRLSELPGHHSAVRGLAFSPDGKRIVTASRDTRVRIWDWRTGTILHLISVHSSQVNVATFSPDGKRVFTGSTDGTARIWRVATPNRGQNVIEHEDAVWGVAFSPQGKILLTGGLTGVQLHDVATGERISSQSVSVRRVAYASDGTRIAMAGGDNVITQREVPSLKPIGRPMRHEAHVSGIDFSPDGSWILSGSFDKTARLWDAQTGRAVHDLLHPDRVHTVDFSPDGTVFLTGCVDNAARLWDAKTIKQIGDPITHGSFVLACKFSQDSALFATGTSAGNAYIWNTRTRQPICGPLHHEGRIRSISFSPDNAYIVTGCEDGSVRFWDVATGRPISLPRRHVLSAYSVAYRPDGAQIAAGSQDGTVRLWDAPPTPLECDVRWAVLWTEVISGQELTQAGVHILDRDTWHQRRIQLEALGGPPLP